MTTRPLPPPNQQRTQHQYTPPANHRVNVSTTAPSMQPIDSNESPVHQTHIQQPTARSRQHNNTAANTTNNTRTQPYSRSSTNSPYVAPANTSNGQNIDGDDEETRSTRKYALKQQTPMNAFYTRAQPWIMRVVLYLIPACIVLYVLSRLLTWYYDIGKTNAYTVVGILTDFPAASKNDRFHYAFQYTALQSWAALVVGYRLLIFADNADACAHIRTLVSGVNCQPLRCLHAEYERPIMNCLMDDVAEHVTTDIIVFVHGEHNIHPSLTSVVSVLNNKHKRFMAVAETHPTVLYPNLLEEYNKDNFLLRLFEHANNPLNIQQLIPSMKTRNVDLFIFTKNILFNQGQSFPVFLYGLYRWDSWFLSMAILDESITVIDVTSSILLVEQHRAQPITPSKLGTAYNDQLVKTLSGNAYKIGLVSNSEYNLIGDCTVLTTTLSSSCTEIINQNVSNVVIFTKRASPTGYLVVLTVNSGYIDLALNWVCWAERIQFRNYILIAEDQQSAIKFRARNCPIIVDQHAPMEKAASDYGTVAFQETMSFRTEFLMSVLIAGFHFVTADMDGLWLDDPIQYFNDHVDLQGQLHKETKISGGLVIVRATSYGKYFWQQVIDCQRANAIFLSAHAKGTYEPAKYTEQYCINELSHGLSSQPLFSKSLLDPWLFPDGKSFFDEHNSQLRGIAPALIHNNWIVGTKNKLNRLKEWKLNSADEEKETCHDIILFTRNPTLSTLSLSSTSSSATSSSSLLKIKVRIVADGRSSSEHLIRLLGQLSDAQYDDDKIDIEVSVDMADASNNEEVARRGELVRLANEHIKPSARQSIIVVEQPSYQGPLNHWISGWNPPETDDQIMVMFDPSTQVSPHWYIWLKRSLQQYYLNETEYDPRLWSIALSRPALIIGETHDMRFGQRIIDETVKTRNLFKYQMLTLNAVAFFPSQWRAFTSWINQQITSKASPCVPTLISNSWFASDNHRHFIVWFHRFVYENGLYTLYTNYDDSIALALSSVILDDTSIVLPPKIITSNQNIQLLQNDSIRVTTFPLSKNIGVYDFHFRLVNVVSTLSWRQYLSPTERIDQCWVVDRLDAKIQADALKLENEKREKILAKRAQEEEAKMKKEQEKLAKQAKEAKAATAKLATAKPATAAAAAAAAAAVTGTAPASATHSPTAKPAKKPAKTATPATATVAATAKPAATTGAATTATKGPTGPPRRVRNKAATGTAQTAAEKKAEKTPKKTEETPA